MKDALQIEILGTGCKKCNQLEANVRQAIAMLNLTAEVVHITDMMQIVTRGVMAIPALVVNGEIVSQGKLIGPEEITLYLK
jgi:small redox-active disulfide protein 2